MDFGVVGFEGLDSSGAQGSSAPAASDAKSKGIGSGFHKQERSGSEEHDWRALKMAKTEDFSASKTMPLHHSNHPLPRSNSLLSADHHSRSQEHMLSFSSLKSEAAGLMERASQNGAFPYYQHAPSLYARNAGYGAAAGGLSSSNMHGHFAGIRGPFTQSQWIELQHQALIYKYITANVPVPSNLLIPMKRSFNPYGLSGSVLGSYPSNSLGWGSFHLGFSSNTDPEPGRCRRTDGKKWRCSRDAVADQKYCERHINRGRHRSRKPVEGQTGHAASGTTNSKVAPMTSSLSTSVLPSGGATNNVVIQQHQFKNAQPGGAAISPSEALVNRMQDTQGLSVIPTIDLKSRESTFPVQKQENPFQESSELEFGLVSSDSLLNPSQRSPYMISKNMGSFLDFSDQGTQDQHPLRQFMDDWPKDQSNRSVITWPEELKSDWTQLSMSIPMASSDFSSSSSSPTHEKHALSPLRLSREFDPTPMGVNIDLTDPNQKQTNWIPNYWRNSMGGPLGEVLTNNNVSSCKNSSALDLLTEGWVSSPQLGSSPTGVLQKAAFGSLSNSSSGSSPRADNARVHDRMSFFDEVLGSTLASSSSIPSL